MTDPFEYIREAYGVPACKGRRIRYKEMPGVIVGVRGAYVVIKLDGYLLRRYTVHPTWKMEYLEDDRGPR